ncbi:MAG: methyltransferase domain-containing protein [Verrucomicrobia bacterium]|nr:methyltransferase domain-containing protein [Verrucomicrobiota bacterium]
MNARILKAVRLAGKLVLSLNLGSVLRVLRFGPGDFRNRLREIFELSNPFECRSDITTMVRTYCTGKGIEVGPADNPYCDPANTVFVDKFERAGQGMAVQKIENAWQLPFADNQFDFLMSSHCLEHCPDAIRTLLEWCRVVRPGGRLVVILPHAFRMFDCGRTLTPLAHHIEDYEKGVGLDDPAPWEEFERISIPAQHHYWLDFPEARLPDGRINRKWVYENGCIHYHVWRTQEMIELLRHVGCRVIFSQDKLGQRPDSFAVVVEVGKSQEPVAFQRKFKDNPPRTDASE